MSSSLECGPSLQTEVCACHNINNVSYSLQGTGIHFAIYISDRVIQILATALAGLDFSQ